MLKEFYEFIAKRINSFFQTEALRGTLLPGESFCLKLDNEKMVSEVYEALEELAREQNSIGEYVYECKGGEKYHTYTLKVDAGEVIIAAQVDGMTNDFLGATLRNAANDERKPILMILANPIDSAKSGTRDMSAYGMPFYADQLMDEIKKDVEKSTQLTDVEKRILQFEIERREADVFGDRSSIYEYKDLLAIMSSGKIDKENFPGFRLFIVLGKTEYQGLGERKIDNEIKRNNELYEKIDRGFRYGTLETDLAKDFEENFIHQIEKAQKEDGENWSMRYTYAKLVEELEKKKKKTESPLEIENEDISIYGDMPLNMITVGKECIIRSEGPQTAKRRTRNLLIFNSKKYPCIHMQIECSRRVKNEEISQDDSEYEKNDKTITFSFERENISFHKIEIKDNENAISYIFKICIIDILADYMFSTVRHCFFIDYKKTKKNCKVKLVGVGTSLSFNENVSEIKTCKLEDNEIYSCSYGERLLITSTEEELANLGSGIRIDISFSGIMIPFNLCPDESKSIEIIGRTILQEKLSSKKSFEFDDGRILSETQEYYAKTNLLRELRLEQTIINQKMRVGVCSQFNSFDSPKIENGIIKLPESLDGAYVQLLDCFRRHKTIPTLAYLGGELLEAVQKYLEEFEACFKDLKEGDSLSEEQENVLLLGTVSVGQNSEEILLSPFHPLNLKYQMALLDVHGIENATSTVISRLNSLNLMPYIQRSKRIYKVSDQLNSQEWKYYAPVTDKKYRGSRRYISKLVEEKVREFVSHFRYIFDDICNRTLRINLINMGDCSEVFVGLAYFYIHEIKKNADVDRLMRFEVHIYMDGRVDNVFSYLKEYSLLKKYLAEQKLFVEKGISMNSLEGILSKNVECYFHKDTQKEYEYSHITFYEMESEITSEQATMSKIETGISLGGILSGIPSSKYGHRYRTGFGSRYAHKTELVELAMQCNALMQVDSTGNPYHSGMSISTQVKELVENKMDYIYKRNYSEPPYSKMKSG